MTHKQKFYYAYTIYLVKKIMAMQVEILELKYQLKLLEFYGSSNQNS